ncbi:peptide chain release factor 1 [Lewinella marina]|uniref:Peptide chain release factor 1 n=1 Tax=Neolewinella marina TaxID=438751 RepID=A0A2G0CI37_9BACT|nr:peptide chain release factor 1 [Neolewinella marina]NJB85226.1 peptide chain release factor 1 [Neolewinella marina]PHK99641.1 peptide chain release factor 1 [Neolewinella marina]
MIDQLEAIYHRFKDLEVQLSDPEVIMDQDRFTKVNKEYGKLKPVADTYLIYKDLTENLQSAEAMRRDPDPEMREMAQLEYEDLREQKEALDEKVKVMLIPKDPEDERDIIMEIRSGTGGDEAALFAGDLFDMYKRYVESMGWKIEVIDENEGTAGGYSKVVFEVHGDDVYSSLKFESGVHRVQRVPKTESQGRVHTSAATVAVLAKVEEADININKADLKIDTFRASGAGGQHVNKTESAIRITHLPTGIVSESQDGRSQHKNKEIAMAQLYRRIKDAQDTAAANELASARKSLVGSGDRSEKIRTYNYPQNRVTDHRINLTLHSLDKVMGGNLEPVIEGLQMAENASKMKEGIG